MEDFITFYYADGSHFAGRIAITKSELILYKKSIFTSLFLGFVGYALTRGKEELRIQINQIANIKKDKYKRNKNACYMTMQNGETYILAFGNPPELMEHLSYRMKIAAKSPAEQ